MVAKSIVSGSSIKFQSHHLVSVWIYASYPPHLHSHISKGCGEDSINKYRLEYNNFSYYYWQCSSIIKGELGLRETVTRWGSNLV